MKKNFSSPTVLSPAPGAGTRHLTAPAPVTLVQSLKSQVQGLFLVALLGLWTLDFGLWTASASQIRFAQTNALTGLPDTNSFLVYHVGQPVLASGGVTTIGLPVRYWPDTHGVVLTNMLAPGNYLATNAYLGNGIVFRCFADSSSQIWNVFEGPPTGLAISGFNTFAVGFFTADALARLATNSFNGNLITASNFLYAFAATNWQSGAVNAGVSNQWRLDATNTARFFAALSTNLNANTSNSLWTALLASTNTLASNTYVIAATNALNLSISNTLFVTSNSLWLANVAATNNALLLSSNFSKLIGSNATNNDLAVSNNLRTLAYTIGVASTNFTVVQSNLIWTALLASTNGLGTAGNVTAGVSNQWRLDATNAARFFASLGTNLTSNTSNSLWTASLAATNVTLTVANNTAQTLANTAMQGATNFARNTIGAAGTNNVIATSNALYLKLLAATNDTQLAAATAAAALDAALGTKTTNFARNQIGADATNYVNNKIGTLGTAGSNNTANVAANLLLATNHFPLGNLARMPLTNNETRIVYFGDGTDYIDPSGSFSLANRTVVGDSSGDLSVGSLLVAGASFQILSGDANIGGNVTANNFIGGGANVTGVKAASVVVNVTNAWRLDIANTNATTLATFTAQLVSKANSTNADFFGQVMFGGTTNITLTTNSFAVYRSQAAGGYFGNGGHWTNRFDTRYTILATAGNYYIQSNGITLYASGDSVSWTAIPPGVAPAPISVFGGILDLTGFDIRGYLASTNLTAQILALATSGGVDTNAVIALIAQYGTNPTNGVTAATVTNIIVSYAYATRTELLSVSNVLYSVATATNITGAFVTNAVNGLTPGIAQNTQVGGFLVGSVTNASFNAAGSNYILSMVSVGSNGISINNGFGTNTTLASAKSITVSNLTLGNYENFSAWPASNAAYFSLSDAPQIALPSGVVSLSGEQGGGGIGGVTLGYNNGQNFNEKWTTVLGGMANDCGQFSAFNIIIGGTNNLINQAQSGNVDYSVILGGKQNQIFPSARNAYTFGSLNAVGPGIGSFAFGSSNTITHHGVVMFNEGGALASAAANTFVINAMKVGIGTNNPGTNALRVHGYVDALGFTIKGVPISAGGGNTNLTPWPSDIDAAAYNLNNVSGVYGISNGTFRIFTENVTGAGDTSGSIYIHTGDHVGSDPTDTPGSIFLNPGFKNLTTTSVGAVVIGNGGPGYDSGYLIGIKGTNAFYGTNFMHDPLYVEGGIFLDGQPLSLNLTNIGLSGLITTNLTVSGASFEPALNGNYIVAKTNFNGLLTGLDVGSPGVYTNTANANCAISLWSYNTNLSHKIVWFLTTNFNASFDSFGQLTASATNFYQSSTLIGTYGISQPSSMTPYPTVQWQVNSNLLGGGGLSVSDTNRFTTTNDARSVNLSNPANSFTGSFTGNGAGVTNVYATNIVGVGPVVNVRNYGAGSGSLATDIAAFVTAQAVQKTTGWPLYIPAGEYWCSNLTYDSTWQNLTNQIGYGTPTIIGNRDYTVIHPGATNMPIFVFTNHLDGVKVYGVNFIGGGINVSTPAALVYVHGTNGTADGNIFEDCSFQNSWLGFRGDTMTSTLWKNCAFGRNNTAGFLEITGTEANNNNRFEGGSIVANNNGFIVNHGSYVVNNLEMGGVGQTNVFLCTNASLVTFEFNGGNAEIDYGAMVKTTNSGYVNIKVSASTRIVDSTGTHGARAVDLAGNIYATGGGDSVVFDGGRLVTIPVRVETNAWGTVWGPKYPVIVNKGGNNPVQVEYVSGVNGTGFTNYTGAFPLEVSVADGGDIRNNVIRLDPGYSFGGGSADMHYVFSRTNLAQVIAGIGIEQYYYDAITGVVPQTTKSNYFTTAFTVASGSTATMLASVHALNNGGSVGTGSGFDMWIGGAPFGGGNASMSGELIAGYPAVGVYGTEMLISVNGNAGFSQKTNMIRLSGVDYSTHVQGSGGLVVDNGTLTGNAANLTNATALAALGPNSMPGSNVVAQMIANLATIPNNLVTNNSNAAIVGPQYTATNTTGFVSTNAASSTAAILSASATYVSLNGSSSSSGPNSIITLYTNGTISLGSAVNVNVSGVSTTGSYTGSGSGLTALPAAQLTGTVPDAQLGSAALTNRANTFTAANTFTNSSAANQGIWQGSAQAGWVDASKGFGMWVGGIESFDTEAHMLARTASGRTMGTDGTSIYLNSAGILNFSDNATGSDAFQLANTRIQRSAQGTVLLSTNLLVRGTGTFTNGVTVVTGSFSGNGAGLTNGTSITWTNFISGQVYTNNTTHSVTVSGSVNLTGAAVTGSMECDVVSQTGGGTAWQHSNSVSLTTTTLLTQSGGGQLTLTIASGDSYCFTNTVTGAGNSVTLKAGTGQIILLP